MKNLVSEIIEELENISDQKHQIFVKKMIPSMKIVYGIKTPKLNEIIKDLQLQTSAFTEREKIELAILLIKSNVFEAGQMANVFVGKDKKIMAEIKKEDLYQMNYLLDNWASVDSFSVYVFGKAWRMGKVSDSEMMELVHHENFWQRRVAIVSTVPLNQKSNGGTTDVERTLMICKEVVDDYEDLIVKALSWALRVLAKVEPDSVHEFVQKYNNVLHKRVLREVDNTLKFGLKNLK